MTTLDYGTDLSCTDDLTETMIEVSGPTVLAQSLYRRLTTRRGGLLGEPNYGYDVRAMLSRASSPRDFASFPAQIRAEAVKEDGVADAAVRVEQPDPETLIIELVCATPEGPLTLTLTVGAARDVLGLAQLPTGVLLDLVTDAEAA